MNREWWEIAVSGYGAFGFYGTEREAEEMRAHKANWEGGVGRKKRVADDSGIVAAERRKATWMKECGYPLSERELEAIAGPVQPSQEQEPESA